jgi:WD40 repeat protein
MTSEKIENDHDVNLKINKEIFHYKSVKKLPILLKGHLELPQELKFCYPKLSKEGKFVTAIGKAKNDNEDDWVYIWNAKRLDKKYSLKLRGISKIQAVDFSPDENIFVIIYNGEPPTFTDYEKGTHLSQCEEINIKYNKILSYSFSKKGKNFAIATDQYFVIYEVQTGKVINKIIDSSPIKVFRGKKIAFIDDNFKVTIRETKTSQIIKEFHVTAMGEEATQIFSIMMSPDKNEIYYLKSSGVYKISIEKGEITQIKISENNQALYGFISDDCKICMTTDMTNANFWDLENAKLIGDIHKEKFNSFSVNFSQSKFITSDDICIDLTDISDDKAEQKYIWLDLNPDKFESITFSPDYQVLLAKVDEHTALAYNCIKGTVIKKWRINLPNWSRTCQMVPETSKIGVIVTKSYNKIIKIWDYLTGTDLSTFTGFDVNNFAFSKFGNFLAAGTVEGEEIARVWDITNGKEYKYYHREQANKNTFVNISKSEPLKVIAVANEQNPLIYDLEKEEFIIECNGCPIQLNCISNVESNEGNNFFIYGKDMHDMLTAFLYDFSGTYITEYSNCRNIEFGKEDKYLLTDSDNINKGYLTISQLSDTNNPIECNISGINSKFLSDNKSIGTLLDTVDQNIKLIVITDVESGDMVAEIQFEKKTDKFTEITLSANKEEKYLLFRFIELENPERK